MLPADAAWTSAPSDHSAPVENQLAQALEEITQLKEALLTRHLIGMAQGVLMSVYGLDVDRAFTYLVRRSQNENIKLRELAPQIVEELCVGGSVEGTLRRAEIDGIR